MPSLQSSSSQAKRIDVIYHPALLWLFRVLVGATFVVSGFVKSVDPWGSFYKISEYIDVWGLDIPSSIVVLGAFVLGGFEFVFGSLLMFGCYRRVAVWLLTLMMVFMLPLTVYIAIADPVADCGCFGDFLILSNTATMVKNVVLMLMLLYLAVFNLRVAGLFGVYIQWVIGGLLSFYIVVVSFFGFNIQPLIDFRRFAPGNPLVVSDADDDDSDVETVYEFVYEKDGKRQTFAIDNLPDSTWTFVDRKVVDGSEELSEGFSVIVDGEDIISDIVDSQADLFLVTIPDLKAVDISYTYLLNELNDYITARGGAMAALVNGDERAMDWWRDISMASYPIYSVESTLIKELARGHAAIVYVRDGVVVWKRTLSSISYTTVTKTPPGQMFAALDPELNYYLNLITVVFGDVIFVIFVLDRSGHLVAWHIRRRKRSNRKLTSESSSEESTPDKLDK